MKRLSFITVIVWLFLPAALAHSQQTTDVELIRGANRQLAAAIEARELNGARSTGSLFASTRSGVPGLGVEPSTRSPMNSMRSLEARRVSAEEAWVSAARSNSGCRNR